MSSNLPLKLGIAIVVLFGLLIAGMLAYKPLMERWRGPVIDTSADLPPEMEDAIGMLNMQQITVNYLDTEVSEAVGFLRDITSWNFIVAPEIADNADLVVTLRLSTVPLLEAMEALEAVTDKVDFGYKFDEKGELVIVFTTPEKAKRFLRYRLFGDKDVDKRKAVLADEGCRFGLSEKEAEKAWSHLNKVWKGVYTAGKGDSYKFEKLKRLIENHSGVSISLSPKAARLHAKRKFEEVKIKGKLTYFQLAKMLQTRSGLRATFTPGGIVLVPPSTYYAMKARLGSNRLERVLKTRRVSLAFQGTPISEVMSFMQDITGLNIILTAGVDVDAGVNYAARDELLEKAFSNIIRLSGYKYEFRGSIIYIMPMLKK